MAALPLDAADIRAELELELDWRAAELRFMENLMAPLAELERAQYRRALIVLVYAHLEGFCKAALSTYGEHINKSGCQVADADWAIGAASLALVFKRLRDNDIKSTVFRNTLPSDAKLHRFCRERDFLQQIDEFTTFDVDIPIDEVVDTESNLKPVVLKKMLYRLGLDEALADEWSGELNRLLAWRNNIAHGATRRPIGEKDYRAVRDAWWDVCNRLMVAVFNAARDSEHLRAATASTPTAAPHP